MKRTFKSVFAVNGTKEELQSFEEVLISHGIESSSANEAAKNMFRWVVVYADFVEADKSDRRTTFAYRSTSCKQTSRPAIIKMKTAKKRLESGYYFGEGKFKR